MHLWMIVAVWVLAIVAAASMLFTIWYFSDDSEKEELEEPKNPDERW